MKNIHASLKILGKRRTVYLNNEMLSKMVHVGMTVSIGEKYITWKCGYNNFFPFNYYYYWYYLEVWPQSVHAFPPCFRCSYKMIKYTRSSETYCQYCMIGLYWHILIILGQLIPWSESVCKTACMRAQQVYLDNKLIKIVY